MDSRIAICAIALGATLVASDAALAKGGGNAKKHQRIAMTRPADAPDPNAKGTVDITHGKKGDQTVLRLDRLDPRTVYEIRDADTGAALGTAKTNRRGHATFRLTGGTAKSASAGGVSKVQVVNQKTGEDVLSGDVTLPDPVPAEGWADYYDDEGDSANVYLFTDPAIPEDLFSLTFYPAFDDAKDPYGIAGSWSFFEMNRDTANGDELPLGVDGANDLAGRAFEIRGADGSVALKGVLPEMIPFDDDDRYGIDDPWYEEPEGGFDWGDWDGGDGNDLPGLFGGRDGNGHASKAKSAKRRRGGVKADAEDGFTLFIADGDGVLRDAGALDEVSYGSPDDGGCYGIEPPDFGNFYVVVILFGSDDAFDLGNFLDQILGGHSGDGGWSCGDDDDSWGGSCDGGDDSSGGDDDGEDAPANGVRHGHR